MIRAALATAFLVLGCAEEAVLEPLEPAPLAEVCGEAGPFRLLALDPDQRLQGSRGFVVAGDRLLFVAGKLDRYAPAGTLLLTETRVYAVGPCGEEPGVVAEGIVELFSEPSHSGVVFGCTQEYDLVRVDPSGVVPPQLLARGTCHPEFTEHGLLAYAAGEGSDYTVDYYPLLDAQGPTFGPPIRVAEPVRTVNAFTNSVRILQDEVLMVEDGELARYSLPELERTVLAYDVVVFQVSDDGRFLFYQGPGPMVEDVFNPVGPIYGRDREGGAGGPIGTGKLTESQFVAPGVLRVNVVESSEHQRLVSLSNYELVEVPADHYVSARLADGRWLTTTGYFGPWYVFDPADGATSLVSERRGRGLGPADEHLDLVQTTKQVPPGTGALVRYFYDGRAPRTLAERANRGAIVRDDGSVLTTVDVDAEWLGVLTVVSPASAKGRLIDERVTVGSNLASWLHPTEVGAVIYGVVDGERTGVWVARPE